jgi:2-C-methyl-D-erythritol 4-phosphate cytidylyltransferase
MTKIKMPNDKRISAVILAAGSGKRTGSKIPKPFIMLQGKPLIWYSIKAFESVPEIENIYVVVSKSTLNIARATVTKYLKGMAKLKEFIIGGKERSDSVLNALEHISKNAGCDIIAIHDSARPFLKKETIYDTIFAARKYGACAPAVPVVDTVKSVDNNSSIKTHLKRKELIAIQTPQVFDFKKILKAYRKALADKIPVTDDTEAYGLSYGTVKITKGDKDLIKITYDADLKAASSLARKYKKLWK